MHMSIQSSAFTNGQNIPVRYTGEGDDFSPPLNWQGLPQMTRELALICDDPDSPTAEPWVHWLVYNMTPQLQSLPEHIPRNALVTTPVPVFQGCNSWPDGQNLGYLGPMPPCGHGIHHYHFDLYAIDTRLSLPPAINKAQLVNAMSGHIVATARLVGTYERK